MRAFLICITCAATVAFSPRPALRPMARPLFVSLSSSEDTAGTNTEESAPAGIGRISFSDLEAGEVYSGKVKRVMNYGAFVNIGAEKDVLVHISEFSMSYVHDVHDYVEEGMELHVKLLRKDDELQRLEGSFILDDALRASKHTRSRETRDVSAFAEVSPDSWLEGKVVKLMHRGALVSVASVSEDVTGFLPNSQIDTEDFVHRAGDYLDEGQDLQVRLLTVNVEQGKLTFTQKADS